MLTNEQLIAHLPAILTEPQSRVLAQAARDGGEIVLAGIDCTEPRPRRDVVAKLVRMGYLREAASAQVGFGIGLHDYYRLTEKGKAWVNQ